MSAETFRRNKLIEDWRKQIDQAATTSAAVVDFLRGNADRGALDAKFVHEQLIRLSDGQAVLFAQLRALGSVMAATDIQMQKVMKAAGVAY